MLHWINFFGLSAQSFTRAIKFGEIDEFLRLTDVVGVCPYAQTRD
ncbi:hypothetical protein N185_17150 [Sinorhizobium sp. GW3]|nr:hypothetical protein N185_17150 [Sinorhizobium sp. GW3]